MTATIRNRIKRHVTMRAGDLAPNEHNFRTHPTEQRAALQGLYDEIGFARSLLAYEMPDGRLKLLDGHLRQEMAPDMEVTVEVLDLDDDEAKTLLAFLDPLAAMAEQDEAKLRALLEQIDTESKALQAIIDAGLEEQETALADEVAEVDLEYSVLVRCDNESDQRVILTELDKHGLDCRAICAGFAKTEKKEPGPAPEVASKGKTIRREVSIKRTPRVRQLEGIFDVPPAKRAERVWEIDFTLDRPWSIGLIVGPSGSGKTTLARELFSTNLIAGWPWPEAQSIVDAFPEAMSIHDITGLLSSVGFSSPPSWLKPFHVLSNGEQFRVTLARTLAEAPELAVVDEFTSVVDRTVAQIGSAALAKTIRSTGRRFVAVSCHYDIEEWLQPDWKYDTSSGQFAWRLLRRRPSIQLCIRRTGTAAWQVFGHHHYLSHDLHRSAKCFIGEVNGQPACFTAVLHRPGKPGFWGEHRTVCLPDFQGVGLGNAMSEFVASLFAASDKQYRSTTSHPAMIRHRCASPLWRMTRAPAVNAAPNVLGKRQGDAHLKRKEAWNRPTASFVYVGPENGEVAKRFGVIE